MEELTLDQQHMEIFDVLSEKYSNHLPTRGQLTEWITEYNYDVVVDCCQAAVNRGNIDRVGGWVLASLRNGWNTVDKKDKVKKVMTNINPYPKWLGEFFIRLREEIAINIYQSPIPKDNEEKSLAIVANEDDIGFMLLNLPLQEEEQKDEETLLRLFWLLVEAARFTQPYPVELDIIRRCRPAFNQYEDTFLELFRPEQLKRRSVIRGIFEEGFKEGLSGEEVFRKWGNGNWHSIDASVKSN